MAGLKRADTTVGAPLRILSLDGGGVRGYSMLILLQELMHRTYVEMHGVAPKRHEIPKPADYFDLIAGTGTGGLIAIVLGRLRLDLETCKDVYVRMTRRVFETDKTIAGIPYRSTLFKASKLEEAIRDCVREHTISEDEGNDALANAQPMTPTSPPSGTTSMTGPPPTPKRSFSIGSRRESLYSSESPRTMMGSGRWGHPDTLLYDTREHRTKTAVTAVYKGTPRSGNATLLRSYDSRKEPAPEVNCTIWQAGRATSATGLAFKPIQIGQSVFIDEGAGKYNPAPQILDEAIINEYPGRELGVFISIGTGKRPSGTSNQQSQWWEGFMGGSMGQFAEARRRLIAKIEGCEETHQYMLKEHLSKRHVRPDNYYRLNVEVGVGEFGMNEWSRLSDISINTHMYLGREEVQNINLSAAGKLAKIQKVKLRMERAGAGASYDDRPQSWQPSIQDDPYAPSDPMAVELPAEDVSRQDVRPMPPYPVQSHQYYQTAGHDDKFAVVSSDEYPQPVQNSMPLPVHPALRRSGEYQPYNGAVDSPLSSAHAPQTPPPLPPKTPIIDPARPQLPMRAAPPVPTLSAAPTAPYDVDAPPPVVNKATKPELRR